MSGLALDWARQWLPRTMAIHEGADPRHAEEGLRYVARHTWENPLVDIRAVETMLKAEINHKGLPCR
jgi:pyrroloquinoline quinone (PQQ) biosynthesis protein C